MHGTTLRRSLAVLSTALLATHLPAQMANADCPVIADSARATAPAIVADVDPGSHYLVGDSVRVALTLANSPAGGHVAFAASGVDRAIVDGGNVLRWRPTRGLEGPNYLNVAARVGSATVACKQMRLVVERVQRAPIVRVSSKQVQAGTMLDFLVGATDPDGDSLSYAVTEMTTGSASASIDSTGRFRWRAPVSVSSMGKPYVFRIEVSDGVDMSTAIFAVTVSGQNMRPECPATIANVTANEGASVLLPMSANDPNGDALHYRAEHDLMNGRVDSTGYRWDIPYGTVENTANERTVDFQWRAIDVHDAPSEICATRVTVRARMEPERLKAEQASHTRFFVDATATGTQLESRLKAIRDNINVSDRNRHRRSIAALATALLAGAFQLAGAEDTRRLAGGINTLTSVFFAGFNTLGPGTDGLKSDARRYEDQIAKYAPMLASFRVNYGETVSEQALRSSQYRADRAALEAEQARAITLTK
jgi:hypothetical protein